MTEIEAKRLLLLRHPDGRDDSDPAMSAALELARQNPALAQWAHDEHNLNQRFASGLRSIQAPPDLLETLLAQKPDRSPVSVSPAPRKRRSARHLAFAAAAAVIVGFAGIAFWPQTPPDLGVLSAAAHQDFFLPEHHLAIIGGQGELARFLSAPRLRLLQSGVPLSVQQLRAGGCRSLQIAGVEILEVCFYRDKSTPEFHLYIALRGRSSTADQDRPLFTREAGLVSAAWADDRYSYVLMTEGILDRIQPLL